MEPFPLNSDRPHFLLLRMCTSTANSQYAWRIFLELFSIAQTEGESIEESDLSGVKNLLSPGAHNNNLLYKLNVEDTACFGWQYKCTFSVNSILYAMPHTILVSLHLRPWLNNSYWSLCDYWIHKSIAK